MTISGFKRSQTFMALNTYFQLSKSEGCFFAISKYSGHGGRVRSIVHTLLIVLVFALEDTEKLNENIEEHFATFPLIILRFVVAGCFWEEMSYLVIFVRDKPLFDRLTFTIFIFKDINNVFRMYPNLLISSSKISA